MDRPPLKYADDKMAEEIGFTSKRQALIKLKEIFDQWNTRLVKVSDKEANSLSFHTDRTLKDDVGHLYSWQKISVARMEAGLSNSNPDLQFIPKEFDITSDDVTKINEWIYKTNVDKNWSQMYSEWKNNFSYLLDLAEKCDEKILLEEGKFPWIEGYSLMAVLWGTFGHHKEHLEKIN